MTETPSTPEPSAAPAPAPASDQVTIELGPDLGMYPEELRLDKTSDQPEPEPAAPEADESATESSLADAGPARDSPQQGDVGQEQGTRRQRGEAAYERGLAEGRAAAERERADAERQRQADDTTRAATQRVELLFGGLESPDPRVQEQARKGILELYRGNQQAAALQTTTRQVILGQIAADFLRLKGADGIDDAAYEQLHSAPDPVELAKRAIGIGRKQRDDEVAKLEAELTQLRGRLVGRTATPQPANGIAGGAAGISWDDYISMSPAEARKLTSRQIDAITAEHFREQAAASANGRT